MLFFKTLMSAVYTVIKHVNKAFLHLPLKNGGTGQSHCLRSRYFLTFI